MKNYQNFAVILLLASIASCQSPTSVRTPSSVVESKDWEELRVLKQRNVELSALSIHFKKKKNEVQLNKIKDEQANITKKVEALEGKLTVFETGKNQVIQNVSSPWREEKERIELASLDLYELKNDVQFPVSTYEAKGTKVTLSHKFFTAINYSDSGSPKPVMNFTVKCDAPFEVEYGLGKPKKIAANKIYKFDLGDKKISNDSNNFIFHPDMNTCEFKFSSSLDVHSKLYGFKTFNETKKLNSLMSLLSTTEVCSLKKGTDSFYETSEFTSMTCPRKYDSIKLLPEPEDSLYARAKALLGQDLPVEFVKNANPYAELDFSKAPKFDAILVSYLVFRSDFYGTLMGRLLAYHADQGALVRVVVSEVITLDKDEAMYERLMAKHPNMKFVKYKFSTDQKNGAWISSLHRTNHVKIFAGYSKANPQDSFLVVGGRNIHDGFAFRTPPEVEKYPEVVNYLGGDESWAFWRDFEMVIHGQDFVESVVRNYMNFYHINKDNLVMKLSSVSVQKEAAPEADEETMRYYVSIPFKDEPNLNLFYARMIDSSKKKLLISSPYFRPVKEIVEALNRAITRGVDITIITRLDLEGDTADFILGAVNKDGVNKFLKKIKVYEYIEPKVILHSKLLLVDDEVSFISSVNLNKRSFYHDMENGVIVNDPKFTKEMGQLYKGYLTLSEQLTETQRFAFWKKWIIQIFDKVL
jgi:cardiolipin synthase